MRLLLPTETFYDTIKNIRSGINGETDVVMTSLCLPLCFFVTFGEKNVDSSD